MVRATRNTLKGDPTLLVAILLSGAWIWLGASINQACSISTLNELAKGHVGKILTIMGWFIGWSIWTKLLVHNVISVEYVKEDALDITNTLIVSITVLVTLTIFVLRFKPPMKLMLGVLSIGLIASLLFYLVPNWPLSQLMNDVGSAVLYEKPTPSFLRIGIFFALLIGMWIAVAINHNAKLRFPTVRSGVRFLIAGTMMGVGAGMALGGNDTQLLFGIPSTSIGSLSALLFMFIGIVCEQLIYQRGGLIYRKT